MVGKQEIVNVANIVVSEEIYPRNHPNWFLSNKYSKAMKAGAVFPPITLGLYQRRRYLIDGKHRLEAYKLNNQTEVQATIVPFTDKGKMFAEAVKLNCEHGQALSTQETVSCINRLRELKFSDVQISKIVSIPVERIDNFVVNRITNTITGEEVSLKAPLHYLHGEEISDDAVVAQGVYCARGQEHIIDQLINLLESNSVNVKNKDIMNKLKVIRKLIEKVVLKTRKN